MGLTIPVVSNQPGPTYATNVNDSLNVIDSHTHAPGSGVPITPAAMNISSDLSMMDNNLTQARSVNFTPQGSPLGTAADIGCSYVSGVDLYYNDSNGNQIRITQSGGVAGSPGSIGGLVSPASVTYVAPTFVFQSDVTVPATLDAGSVILRNLTAASNGITLQAPGGLASNYSITYPGALPGAQSFVTLDGSGNIAAPIAYTGGIVAANLASRSVTSIKRADASVVKTGTYTVLNSDETVFCSSSSYTITLPTAVGIGGTSYRIMKTDNNIVGPINISLTTSSVSLRTGGEVYWLCSDNTSWRVLEHQTKTAPVLWTPVFSVGFGTVTSPNVSSYRDGKFLYVQGSCLPGSLASSAAQMSVGYNGVDANVTIDTTLMGSQNQPIGIYASNGNGQGGNMLYMNSATQIGFAQNNSAALSQIQVANATATNPGSGSGGILTFKFAVAIAEWTA